jgi:hypothetical protein
VQTGASAGSGENAYRESVPRRSRTRTLTRPSVGLSRRALADSLRPEGARHELDLGGPLSKSLPACALAHLLTELLGLLPPLSGQLLPEPERGARGLFARRVATG